MKSDQKLEKTSAADVDRAGSGIADLHVISNGRVIGGDVDIKGCFEFFKSRGLSYTLK